MIAKLLGNRHLFAFWLKHALRPLSLPRELYDEEVLKARMLLRKPFEVVVDGGRDYVEGYAEGLERLKADLQDASTGELMDYHLKQVLFWVIRITCVACASTGSFWFTFVASLLQFLVLPYSLFVSIAYGLETMFVLYSGHVIVYPLLTLLLQRVIPSCYYATVVVGPRCLATFLIVDQMLCVACLFKTPKGKSKPMAMSRIFQSVWYGFLNCKTYFLVLFLLSFGLEVPILVWLLDAALGLSSRLSGINGRFWPVLFYHVHRMGHVTHVYPDAHKFHHHLHDSTAFDAHIFGSGAPEEWLILMFDLYLVLGLGYLPASLSYHVLQVSWMNKWSFHTRSDDPAGHSNNFHVDHHTYHTVNFGFTPPYELFMKTLPTQVAEQVTYKGFKIERVQEGSIVRLLFTPRSEGG
eukprot:TRINITY_DN65869_c0_g1_i1.p1 TRINITY_DN65869_c0_g1~~TRINITY_DN65869_c0_g1_i1.p1  ORF type:complete len:418 (+),score=27.54 TRINITY_DN65869_c0_g1_i1:29-1255(+)